MSIIEKAIGRLGKPAAEVPPASSAAEVRLTDALEAGVNKALNEEVPVADAFAAAAAAVRPTASKGDSFQVELPLQALHEHGMLTPLAPRSRIAEEYRLIKRPLLRNIAGRGASRVERANLIMVTSALEGDGKTFSAINLALSLAMERDKTVLFVDADISKATACRQLHVPLDAPGLIDVLEHADLDLSDVLLRTNLENLRILPAGKTHDRATELLASERMQVITEELSTRYSDRIVIFDAPPLLRTTEAGVLTNLMGQIVFVVSADTTPQSAVLEAIEHIGSDKVIGMVLNRSQRKFGKAYGYGGYGYGYGYGHGERESREGVVADA